MGLGGGRGVLITAGGKPEQTLQWLPRPGDGLPAECAIYQQPQAQDGIFK